MIQIVCRGERTQKLKGYAEFKDSEGNDRYEPIIDGKVFVPDGTSVVSIKPVDGHWSTHTGLPPNLEKVEITCASMSLGVCFSWWRKLMLSGDEVPHDAGEGLRIGVIDLPFLPSGGLAHVQMLDIEGQPFAADRNLPPSSHGHRVCKLLADRSDTSRGLLPGAEVILIDVSDDYTHEHWDFEKIAPAIELLIEELNVDFINISGGSVANERCPPEDFEDFFSPTMAIAEASGALVFAAVGNDPSVKVAYPAALRDVVGVGALGTSGIAPAGTTLRVYEEVSKGVEGASGHLPDGHRLFHYIDSTFGDGLDVVGPGMAIVVQLAETIVGELYGTSYACPIVLGAIARRVASAHERHVASAEERRKLLQELCVDLGMERSRQGWGLPLPGVSG